jgi:hypothetical protein
MLVRCLQLLHVDLLAFVPLAAMENKNKAFLNNKTEQQ